MGCNYSVVVSDRTSDELVMTADQFNKIVAGSLVLATIAAYTILAIAHVGVPDYVQVLSGVVAGFAIHAFGVSNGTTATLNGVKSGELKNGNVHS